MQECVTNYFTELYKINLNDVKEGKNHLDYISWTWAWARIKERYPEAFSTVYEDQNGRPYFNDGKTCWVKVGMTINGLEHIEYLPIMDNRNKSIPVDMVTSMDMNKSIQRATVKAIARHGLGLYVYAGEDLPEGLEDEEEKVAPTPAKKPAQPVQSPVDAIPVLDAFCSREQYIDALRGMKVDVEKLCEYYGVVKVDDISTEQLYKAYCNKYHKMSKAV